MSTTISTQKICTGYEPIAGYVLEEKIGQGGFGEVWRADAPGGLKKAVKFVFGASDANRGSRELKSLERIKGVHHPFLLTLERFGIVDDQLVIVTELADGSLEDIYDRHRERGSCGIPRNALLKYLHDAADALDYLHSDFQLQHLDIKPGNLLLVGGHVKVGDFGLLKDLREADCSIVGGLTPIYAPPEVFDGRPSLQSDQYSMAVMYQELLTGTRPFSGRTIAQLATQHVHSSPNLEPLPPGDRPIIARALEKNPDGRFASCIDLIDALRDGQSRASQMMQVRDGRNSGDTQQFQGLTNGQSKPEIEDLPQLNSVATEVQRSVTSHTMVVALGGAGAECLRELRSRVANLHSACPVDLHSILIDTDLDTIHAAKMSELSDRVPHCNSIYTPLKAPQEYREKRSERFRTVSRRWIYNVPRSGRTEGMRPLGRLAMVDHGREIKSTLYESIEHLAAMSGDRTPNIYVVGSIAGGTCSGMYLDILHLLRSELDAAGLEQTRILSLMAAAPLQGNPQNPLALHDTAATAHEMRYFMQPGNGYPGDDGAGFPSVPAARTPLHDAYIITAKTVHGQTISPIDSIVDYLWADSTGAGELLAEARKDSGGDAGISAKPAHVRSVGVVRLGCLRALEENLLTPALVRHLFLRWLGRPNEAKQIAKPLCDRLIRRCEIDSDSFRNAFLNTFGADANERRCELTRHIRRLPPAAVADPMSVENYLTNVVLDSTDATIKQSIVASIMVGLQRELTVRLHDRRLDLTSAIEAIRLLVTHLDGISAQLDQQPEADLTEIASSVGDDSTDAMIRQFEDSCEMGIRLLTKHAEKLTVDLIRLLTDKLTGMEKLLECHAASLAQAIQQTTKTQRADENPWTDMPQEIQLRFEPLMVKLHSIVAEKILLDPIRRGSIDLKPDAIVETLTAEALPLVADAVDSAESPELDDESDDTTPDRGTVTASFGSDVNSHSQTIEYNPNRTQLLPDSVETSSSKRNQQMTIESALRAVRPELLNCGGRQRLLLLVGNAAEREQLEAKTREAHGGAVTVVMIPGITPMLIHEAQQIRLSDVINRLSVVAGGDRQVSARLQSRADIDWMEHVPSNAPFGSTN